MKITAKYHQGFVMRIRVALGQVFCDPAILD